MNTATASRKPTVTTTPDITTETALLDEVLEKTAAKLDAVATRFSAAIRDETLGRLKRALVTAKGIAALKALLSDDVMRWIMPLANTQLGFRTDRDPNRRGKNNDQVTPYPVETVRDCLVAALLRGVYPFGNEFNIIAASCYITKEGYQRKVRELPELTDLKLSPGTPFQHNGLTVVRYAASWRLHGLPDQLMGADGKPGIAFAINTPPGTGVDAIIGKATRHALKQIYEQAVGSELSEEDGEVDELPDDIQPPAAPGQSKSDSLADKLGAKPSGSAPALETTASSTITETQYLHLVEAIQQSGIKGEIVTKQFGLRTLNRLPADRFDECCEWIAAFSANLREPGEEG